MTMEALMILPLFIGTTELLLIGGMALLLFGGKKLPEMMRGLGQGVKEFKKGMNEVKAPADDETPDDETPGDSDGQTEEIAAEAGTPKKEKPAADRDGAEDGHGK